MVTVALVRETEVAVAWAVKKAMEIVVVGRSAMAMVVALAAVQPEEDVTAVVAREVEQLVEDTEAEVLVAGRAVAPVAVLQAAASVADEEAAALTRDHVSDFDIDDPEDKAKLKSSRAPGLDLIEHELEPTRPGRPNSPIFVWEPMARVKLASDLPPELFDEPNADDDALESPGAPSRLSGHRPSFVVARLSPTRDMSMSPVGSLTARSMPSQAPKSQNYDF